MKGMARMTRNATARETSISKQAAGRRLADGRLRYARTPRAVS